MSFGEAETEAAAQSFGFRDADAIFLCARRRPVIAHLPATPRPTPGRGTRTGPS